MLLLLLTLLLVTPSDAPTARDRCDSLYTAARSAREQVVAGKDQVRSTETDQQQWRQTVRRFLTLTRKARQCYGPLPESPDVSSPRSEETNIPTPTSLQRERFMRTYDWMTFAYRELQQYDKSFEQFDGFFQQFSTLADSALVALMYHKRAYLHQRLGNLSASINDYTKAIAHTPAADFEKRIRLIRDLGVILQKARDMKSAREHYVRAEEMARQLPPSPQVRTLLARTIFNQGDVLLDAAAGRDASRAASDRRRAIRHIQEALELYPSNALERRARAHIDLGEAYSLVDDSGGAFRHLREGRRLAERLNNPDVLALAELKLGKTHVIAGALDAAEPYLRRAVKYGQVAHDNDYHRRALHYSGKLHEMQEDWSAAEDYYRQAIALTEELRGSLRATDWAAGAFDEWVIPYRGLVRVLVAQDRYEAAFRALQRTRARHLQDLRMQARLTSTLPPRERVRFDSLTAELADVRNALAKGDLSDSERDAFVSQEVQLMAERRTLLDLDETSAPPSLATMQQRLRPRGRALVSYFIDDPDPFLGRAPQSFAFVLTADTLRFVPLDVDNETLTATLSDVSPLLTGEASATINTARFDLNVLHQLHQQLVAPLDDALPPDAPLVVIPDGPLFQLPFGMLVKNAPARFAYTQAQFLIEERPVASELAASLLADTTAVDDYPLDLVALGRSAFDALPELPPSLRSRLDSTGGLPALPGVRRELDALDGLFARRRVLLDAPATEDTLRYFQDRTRVLHLASHALVHPSDPLSNLFVLAPGQATDADNDGLLFLHEMERQQCPIPLVVLSGCSTARGLMQTGEGPRGLQYAFRAAGAQSTLSTLWETDDAAATELTRSFYRHLQDGLPKDVALQRAQLAYLDTHPDRASPFFWAGAVLYGNTRPLSLDATAPIPLLPLAAGGAVLLLVAAGFGYIRLRRRHG